MILILFLQGVDPYYHAFFHNPFLDSSLISWFPIYRVFAPLGVIDYPAGESASSGLTCDTVTLSLLCVFCPESDFTLFEKEIEIDFSNIWWDSSPKHNNNARIHSKQKTPGNRQALQTVRRTPTASTNPNTRTESEDPSIRSEKSGIQRCCHGITQSSQPKARDCHRLTLPSGSRSLAQHRLHINRRFRPLDF